MTAEAVAAGTSLVRTFRSPSPPTDAIFASPLHSHEEPSRGAGGRVLDMMSVYDTRILEAPDVLTVLRARGIAVPDAARERIVAERDPERLERWLEKAAVATSVAEVLDEPS